MNRARVLLVGVLVAIAAFIILLLTSIYVVDPTKNAIVLRFGQPVNVTEEEGLYFKVPLIDNVVYIERRLLDLSSPSLEVFADQQARLVVDAFARYRVIDPLTFYIRTGSGNLATANARLSDFLTSSVRDVLGASTYQDIVANDRANLMQQITVSVNTAAAEFGVEIVDVRLRRADLPTSISQSVFDRMRTQRQQEAAQIRAEGEELSRTIRAGAERLVTETLAIANQEGEVIRGDGDAQANRIFAEAYGLDRDFFAFYRSMQAYQQGLTADTTTMVLSPDSAFLRYFNQFGALGTAGGELVLPPVEVPEVEVPEVDLPDIPPIADPLVPGIDPVVPVDPLAPVLPEAAPPGPAEPAATPEPAAPAGP